MTKLLFAVALLFCSTLALADSNVSKQGIYTVIHADNEDGTSTNKHVVHENNGKDTELEFTGKPPKRGSTIKLQGVQRGNKVKVQKFEVLGDTSATVSELTNTTSLYILVNFANNTAQPFTQAAVQAVVVGNSNSVQAFYPEVSYGLENVAITVTPWLTATINQPTTCDYSAIGTAANAAATAAGYNLANYKFKMYVMPQNSACAWLGLAYLGSPYTAWSNGRNSGQVFTHEQGHNHGIDHAGSVSAVGPGASVSEYGDTHDTMGNTQMRHYNGMQKVQLGWLTSAQYKVNAGTETYTLVPFETPGAGTFAVKIPTTNPNRTYWIEYRQPVGIFDATDAGGVQLRLSAPFETTKGYDNTQILTTIANGATYTDATYGISIHVTAADSSGATVVVTAPAAPITCTLTANKSAPVINTTVTLTDNCSNSPTTYTWTNCSSTGSTCVATSAAVGPVTYSVTASNATSTVTKSVTLTWVAVPACTPKGHSGKCR